MTLESPVTLIPGPAPADAFCTARPLMTLCPVATSRPWPRPAASITISITALLFGVAAAAPTWVYPSIVTVSVIVSRSVTGAMTCGPRAPMLKTMVSGPAALFAVMIAWRSDPAPASAVVVTEIGSTGGGAARAGSGRATRPARTSMATPVDAD